MNKVFTVNEIKDLHKNGRLSIDVGEDNGNTVIGYKRLDIRMTNTFIVCRGHADICDEVAYELVANNMTSLFGHIPAKSGVVGEDIKAMEESGELAIQIFPSLEGIMVQYVSRSDDYIYNTFPLSNGIKLSKLYDIIADNYNSILND